MNPYNFVMKGYLLLKPSEALECVSGITGVSISDMQMPDRKPGSRKREIVVARHTYCWLMKNYTKKSLATIGGNITRDHATVLHGIKTMNNLIDTDKSMRQLIGEVISECYSKDAEARKLFANRKTEAIETLKGIKKKPELITCSIQWSDEYNAHRKAEFDENTIEQMLKILNGIYKKPINHVFSYKTRKGNNNQRRYRLLQKYLKSWKQKKETN